VPTLKKPETSQINNLMIHIKLLVKQEQTRSKTSRQRDPKNSIKKLLEIINSFGKVARYKINIQKSVAFLYINNTQTEKEIRETIPFSIASKTIKYLGINLMKETKVLFNENCKPLKREIKEDIRRWRELPCS
jgi:hypothetical protein